MAARRPHIQNARRFLRWRRDEKGIDFVDLRTRGFARETRNGVFGVYAGRADLDVLFRERERHGYLPRDFVRGDE